MAVQGGWLLDWRAPVHLTSDLDVALADKPNRNLFQNSLSLLEILGPPAASQVALGDVFSWRGFPRDEGTGRMVHVISSSYGRWLVPGPEPSSCNQ